MSIQPEQEFERMTKSRIEFFPSLGPLSSWTLHLHPAVEILYFTEGEHTVTVNDMVFHAKPGDLAVVRSNAVHVLGKEHGTRTLHYALKIHPDVLFSAFMDAPHAYVMEFFAEATAQNTFFRAEEIPKAIREQIGRMIDLLQGVLDARKIEMMAEKDALLFATLRCEAIALLLLISRHLCPPVSDAHPTADSRQMVQRIMEAVDYIEANYASPITPQDCAAHLCMSYSHFAKQFHTVTGRTFKQYLTYVRITRAEADLLTTSDPVTEVAMRAGFNNVSHFIATYRTLRGKTPLETRKERREE